MDDRRLWGCLILLLVVSSLGGCSRARKPLKYFGDKELGYYKDVATQIDFVSSCEPTSEVVQMAAAPRRIRHPRQDEVWDMPLVEAIQTALANSQVIRNSGQFLQPGNFLLSGSLTVFDPAIQESGVLFGGRGVEAALADFDARFTTSMLWGRNEAIQNNLFLSGGLQQGRTLTDETGSFTSRVDKQMAYGGSFAVVHNWNYSLNNVPSRLFGSAYTGLLRAEYRHPLMAGSGAEYTRIAGPAASSVTGISGVNQGVVIARINNDISIADFQANVRNLLKDAEDLYWNLSLAYRTWDSELVARNSALETWRFVKSKADQGLPGGSASDEAQARDNYFESRARAENALADVYSGETRLRRLLGLAVNDGRVIRPVDEPVTAEFVPDWHIALAEALTRRVELRRQKWSIKSLELQLRAANSLVRPRLDFVSNYQVNGFGDRLFGQNDNDGVFPPTQGLHSAYETLTQGDQTGWNVGFEFSMPLGFRTAHAQMRNIELQIARARAFLSAQELEISHELANAFQNLDRWYKTAQTNFNRRRAAHHRVQAFAAEYEAGRTSLDLLLRSQISLAQAEIAYFRSLIEYNKTLADIHYRKGTLLEQNNVHLSEGLWDPDAYLDALRRAWARSHAFDSRKLHTEPEEFVTDEIGSVGLVLPPGHSLMNGDPNDPATGDVGTEPSAIPTLAPVPSSEVDSPGVAGSKDSISGDDEPDTSNIPGPSTPPFNPGVTWSDLQRPWSKMRPTHKDN